ncbi:MAG TPA: hypothetical protein VFE37_17145 [Chloroflexota bacterium]|nr:hypothetical protein [Chloroflexota bacterium]
MDWPRLDEALGALYHIPAGTPHAFTGAELLALLSTLVTVPLT